MVLLDARPDYDEACSLDVVMDGISSYILAQQVEPCSYPRPLHAQERRASDSFHFISICKSPLSASRIAVGRTCPFSSKALHRCNSDLALTVYSS